MTARPVLGKVEDSVTAAGRGRQVLVLESDGSPGGYAQCFHRGPYRFDCSLHASNGLAPGGGMDAIFRELASGTGSISVDSTRCTWLASPTMRSSPTPMCTGTSRI